jgi:signal transduction histidine kinase
MSLRAKLIGLFFLLAVVPLVGIGVLGYLQSMRALRSLIAAQAGAIAERAGSELSDRYARRESDLLLLAENAETQRLYRARASGDAAQWAAALPVADAYLRGAWEQFSRSYEWVEFRDGRGFVLYRLGEPLADAAGSGTRGALTVTKPIVGPGGGPAYGTLVAVVRRDALIPASVLENRFGRAGYTMVLDRGTGEVVYHPRHSLIRQRIPALLGPAGWGVDTALIARARGSFRYSEHDTARVAAFVSLAAPPWTVLSSGAVDEFAAPFLRTRLVNLALVLLVTATTAVMFVALTRRSTRSLEALTTAADEVGGGNLAPDLPRAGSDEVGRLSAAFGMMVGRVRGMLREIAASRHMAAVGEFAAQLSHEIRNPLTSIKLNLQQLQREGAAGRLPPGAALPVSISLREIERLDRVVRGVLALGRTRPMHRAACSVHAVVAEALALVRPQLEQQGVAMETDFRAATDAVLGDAEHLKALFLNLFLNAAHAMPGGGRLSVATETDEANGGPPTLLRVRVADTGPGIPAELRQRIFEPFYSTQGDGSGFGLPLALRTVEEHGGRLVLEDAAAAEGASFLVELPMGDAGAHG